MGLAFYVPIVLVVAPVAGYFLGSWLDSKLGTGSWLTWICILLGFGAAARQIYHIVRRIQQEQEKEDSSNR
jgi:F0F1-type ATP synthase assembly protein I